MAKMIFFTFYLILLIHPAIFGQQDLDRDVVVVKTYMPTIADAFKISSLPKINDTAVVHPVFEYTVASTQIKTSFRPEPVNPAKLLSEPLPHLYGNYLKLGIGTQLNPMAELYINSLWSRKNSWGVYLKHFSANAKTKVNGDTYYPWLSENKALLTGTQFLTKSTLTGRLEFNSNKYFRYGYDPDSMVLVKDDIKRRIFTLINADATYRSNYITGDKLNYLSGIDYYFFGDNLKSRENSFSFKVDIDEKYKGYYLGIKSGISFYNQADANDLSTSQTYIEVSPFATRKGEEWEYTVGIKTSTEINPDENAKLHIYPDLKFSFIIVDKIMTSYFGFTGKNDINSYRKLAENNPYYYANQYIDDDGNYRINSDPTNYKKIIYGGLRGYISKRLSYNAVVKFSETSGHVFYLADSTGNCFTDISDNLDIFDISGELAYKTEKLEIRASGNIYSYAAMDSIIKPSYMPAYNIDISAGYNLKDKILLNCELIFAGERNAVNIYNKSETLGSIADINLGAEYRYTKKMSAFLNLNNIANQKYFIWQHYPSWGFNVMFGVTYAF